MRRPLLSATAATAALALLFVSALPAAALNFNGMGFYARFGPSMGTDVRGLVIGDRLGGDRPRLNVGLVGLLPHIGFTIVGRSIGCGGTPAPGNRIFRVNATADANGDAFFTRIMAEWGRLDLRSTWIDWGDGPVCALSLNFQKYKTTDLVAGGALGLTKIGDGTLILLVERRPNDRARLSIVVNGLSGDDVLRVRLVDEPCGTPPSNAPLSYELKDVLISSFRWDFVPLGLKQLDALFDGSIRIRNVSGNNSWCGPVSLIIVVA
ncbi:MAG: hypothetical protein A2146_03320 [Actinobacteria bacterium RBG_16_67_10]|nr:MAG: hypothetical protein A2146_03320 [Actinobacteria bacterium RBG_16_67_10]